MSRPKTVRIRLAELRMGEEFETGLAHHRGVVVDWGFVRDVDRTGRVMRVRAVKVRFGTVERIYSGEMVVLVPFERPHACRQERDEGERWGTELREPALQIRKATLSDLRSVLVERRRAAC